MSCRTSCQRTERNPAAKSPTNAECNDGRKRAGDPAGGEPVARCEDTAVCVDGRGVVCVADCVPECGQPVHGASDGAAQRDCRTSGAGWQPLANRSGAIDGEFTLPEEKYETDAQRAEFFEELLRRARAVPGVSQASVVSVLPGAGHFFDSTFAIEGAPPLPPGQFRDAVIRGADPDHFAAMHIPMKRGRIYTTADHQAANDNGMVITESMARSFLPEKIQSGKQCGSTGTESRGS
jgi:hypothetical protein